MIDNTGNINYEQLYAQVLHEIRELQAPYWFNNEEVARIQELNLNFMEQKDLSEIVDACFRKPLEGEHVKSISTTEMLTIMQQEYPSIKIDVKNKAYLGRVLKSLDYVRKDHNGKAYYKAVPLKVA
jgi:tRNA U34 5-carboxymethylaminomethyl modifying enzyme MnmG/GidA